jgi:hypothetical protein
MTPPASVSSAKMTSSMPKGAAQKIWRVRNFGLTLVLLALFAFSIGAQLYYGYQSQNEERVHQGLAPFGSLVDYSRSGHFISSVAENMESEFLQMGLFVFLTMCLFQKGSAESQKPEEERTAEDERKEAADEKLSQEKRKLHPIAWRLYESSLTTALLFIFVLFFALHAFGSWEMLNEEKIAQGESAIRFLEVLSEPEFWFESFQNWQSEFFSIAAMGILSIFLRQKGSPQSKHLTDANWKTGNE